MGGEESNPTVPPQLQNFDLEKYKRLNPNLTEGEILEIYGIFVSLRPDSDGFVITNRVLALYHKTQDYPVIKEGFRSYQKVDFNQFLSVLAKDLKGKKTQFQNVEFESNIQDVSCFICPIPSKKETIGRDSVRVMSKNTHGLA